MLTKYLALSDVKLTGFKPKLEQMMYYLKFLNVLQLWFKFKTDWNKNKIEANNIFIKGLVDV